MYEENTIKNLDSFRCPTRTFDFKIKTDQDIKSHFNYERLVIKPGQSRALDINLLHEIDAQAK